MRMFLRLVPVVLAIGALAVTTLEAADAAGTSKSPAATASDDPYKWGQDLVKDGKFKEAEAAFMMAAQKDPTNADALNMLAYSERRQGEFDEAFENYAKALALDPDHKGAHKYIGESCLMAGNLAKAEEHLAALWKICSDGCDESRMLAKSVQLYNDNITFPLLDAFW
ncbi:MAG: tetratricopeptide repeat protein [Alphaproteobacteria bacterium]|nr:tetratricopeptide repeat protein [Alphaproteobacteria bacterium]